MPQSVDVCSLSTRFEEPLKFAIVGLSGVGVNFGVLSVSIYIFSLSDPIAIGLAIIVSMSTNYLLNRIWTFKSTNPLGYEYLRYALSNSAGILTQYGVALLLEKFFESLGWNGLSFSSLFLPSIYFASSSGILLGFLTNFLFSKYFVFD